MSAAFTNASTKANGIVCFCYVRVLDLPPLVFALVSILDEDLASGFAGFFWIESQDVVRIVFAHDVVVLDDPSLVLVLRLVWVHNHLFSWNANQNRNFMSATFIKHPSLDSLVLKAFSRLLGFVVNGPSKWVEPSKTLGWTIVWPAPGSTPIIAGKWQFVKDREIVYCLDVFTSFWLLCTRPRSFWVGKLSQKQ